MLTRWFLAAFGQEIFDALFDVRHPFLFLCAGCGVNGERFSCLKALSVVSELRSSFSRNNKLTSSANEPTIAKLAFVLQRL
jgi:hypothetical protein